MKKNQTQKINEYRSKHHRCRFCRYWEYRCKNTLFGESYTACSLKGTTHFYYSSHPKVKGMFCRYYEPREVKGAE